MIFGQESCSDVLLSLVHLLLALLLVVKWLVLILPFLSLLLKLIELIIPILDSMFDFRIYHVDVFKHHQLFVLGVVQFPRVLSFLC